jgi:hypothetical protein
MLVLVFLLINVSFDLLRLASIELGAKSLLVDNHLAIPQRQTAHKICTLRHMDAILIKER